MSASTPDAPDTQPSFKRLAFIHRVLNLAVLSANVTYLFVRSVVPSPIVPVVSKAEEKVAAIAAPYYAKAQDYGALLLHFADDEADLLLSVFESRVAGVKSTAKAGTDTVNDVAQPYLRALNKASSLVINTINDVAQPFLRALYKANLLVIGTINDVAQPYLRALYKASVLVTNKIHTASGLQAVQNKLHDVVANSDPDQAIKAASDTCAQFAAFPPVAVILRLADPLTSRGLWAFQVFHDRLVSTHLYKFAVDTTASTLTYASTTTPYKLSAQYLYPVVQPVADPALEKVSKSAVIKKTLEFWEPVVI